MRRKGLNVLLAIPYIMITVVPLILFFEAGLIQSLGGEKALTDFGMRETVLLIKSVFFGGGVAGVAVLFGATVAIGMLAMKGFFRRLTAVVLLLCVPLPSAVHTMMWMTWLTRLKAVTGFDLPVTGWGVSILVQSVMLLPLTALIIYDGMRKIPYSLTESGQLMAGDFRVLWRIWLPQSRTALTTAGIAAFLMTFNDYSIPSSFAVNTFAMEVFARYSIGLSAGDAMLASLPMLLVGVLLITPLLKGLEQQFLEDVLVDERSFVQKVSGLKRYLPLCVWVLLSLLLFLPFIHMAFGAGFSDFNLSEDGGKDILNSLLVSAGAALAGLPVMMAAAAGVVDRDGFNRRLLLILLLPGLMSPSLIGAALIDLYDASWLRSLYLSPVMAVQAVMIRFMPFGVLVLVAGLKSLPKDMISAAYMTGVGWRKVYSAIVLPLIRALVLVAVGLVFLMGIGEVGASVMVLPPGISTIAVRLYGYLHYGATEMIVEISLVMVAILVAVQLFLYLLAGKMKG